MTSGADYGFGCVALMAVVGGFVVLGAIVYGAYKLAAWIF